MNSVTRLLVASMLLCTAVPGDALTFVKLSDSALLEQADVIVEGRILEVDKTPGVGRPVTDYLLEIRDVISGQLQVSPIVVRTLGGEFLDGSGLYLTGVPRLQQEERLLVFLKAAENGTFRILHVNQGLFRITEVDGKDVAIRSFDHATEMDLKLRVVDTRDRVRDLEGFRQWLASSTSTDPSPQDYFLDLSAAAIQEKFTLISDPGIRFREFDSGSSVRWRAHQSGQPGLASGGFPEFQSALAAWTNDSSTPIRYLYAGTTTADGGLQDFDGVNAINWADGRGFDEGAFRCSSGGTIAMAGPWFSGTHVHNGELFRTAVGGDIQTNVGIDCLTDGAPFISQDRTAAEVFAHELGHTLGLGHSCGDSASPSCSNSTLNQALMRASVHSDNRGAQLFADDRAAIRFLYGEEETNPAAPTGLTATAITAGRIDLSWTDRSDNETSFEIERRTSIGSFQQIASKGSNSTSHQDVTVESGTTYSYRVRARNSAGPSSYSNTATASSPGEPAPTNLVAAGLSSSRIRLSWEDNSDSELGYQVEGKTSTGPYRVYLQTAADVTTVDIDSLDEATFYTFRVRAFGGLGNSSYSNESTATTFFSDPEPCVADASTLCLNQGRFRVTVDWRDFNGGTGVATDAGLVSPDSGLFWFFSENNWELLVKVLDGCSFGDRFWVFAAATTDVEYTLHVTDTVTGFSRSYQNPLGVASAAVTDTDAFATCSAIVPEGLQEAEPPSVPEAETLGDEDCRADGHALCLNGGRYGVDIVWRDFANQTGPGVVDDFRSGDSGLMYFFSPENLEVLVKVLDGCSFNDKVWVFAAATTNVEYTLTVTDTQSGAVRQYFNPLGTSASAITDTNAFEGCN